MIPYGKQDINADDIDAVIKVLKSDYITQGPMVPAFEDAVKAHVSAKHALAVNSATSALHIACLALDVGKGDIVWTSPISFVASSNCALYCGGDVDFVDIDPQTYNMSVVKLEEKLLSAEKTGQLPKVVIPVHLCGQPCDMERIALLANKYNFKIIEDASHAIGGKYKDQPVGNCQYSDITVFSFHPVKIITTAEGGMMLTNDDKLAMKMNLLRSHGITKEEHLLKEASHGPWYYQQIELGFNYRMTDIQAALGLSQMKRLDEFIDIRQSLAKRYDELLEPLPVITPYQIADSSSARHLYVIKIDPQKTLNSHREIFESMREGGIGVNLHYIPIHLQPYYQNLGFKEGDYPIAEEYYSTAVSIPLYTQLSHVQQDQIIAALKDAIN